MISPAQIYLSQKPRAYQVLHQATLREKRLPGVELLSSSRALDWAKSLGDMNFLRSDFRDYRSDVVQLGKNEDLSPDQKTQMRAFLESLMPWRKGPFEYFGERIEAEWQSNLKWDRFSHELGYLGQEIWADVGCNNEYYMYRLLQHKPDLIVGFDPVAKYFMHHLLNRTIYPIDKLVYELMGVQDLGLFSDFFHGILFMGVLYHRRSPLESLEHLNGALKKGGRLILETIIIPGKDDYCLFPSDRYLKSKGYWFLPMKPALLNMVKRSGFKEVKVIDITTTTTLEQRKTPWIKTQTLEDFLNPKDPSVTVEGLPAPQRIILSCRK